MVCKEFSRNPGKNPRTKRSISPRGKVYKALVKECGSPKKSPQSFQKSKCGDFEKNPSVNPYTNRKIKLFGSTFKKLISKCGGKKQSTKKKTPVAYIDPMFLESPKKQSPKKNSPKKQSPLGEAKDKNQVYIDPMFLDSPKKKSPKSPNGWGRKMITLPNGKFALVPTGKTPPSPLAKKAKDKKRTPKKKSPKSPKSPFFTYISPTVEYRK